MKKRFLLLITLVLSIVINASAQKLSQVSSTLNLGSVYYMTKDGNVDADGVLYDQKVIDDLKAAGYELTQGYPGEGGVINPVELNKYDAVVVGRNISSGDFALAEDWANLEAPVLMLSGYIVRSNRLKYLNTTKVNREATEAVESNKDRVTKALIADTDDYVFKNISTTDNKMDYMTWFYDYLAYGIDSFATTNNGKLLASIVDADTAAANGNVLMARWEPGKETYTGSGVTPKAYRSYLQIGADDKSDPKLMNYAQYTPASFQLMLNEINYLVRTGKDVQYMVKEGNVDADGVLYDQQVIDDLKDAGYANITKTYPGEGGAINKVDLNNSDLVVVGRNISSGDFALAEEWAELEAPVLMLSGYIVRSNRLKYLNTTKVNREATEAVESNKDRITKALVADVADSSFMGVAISADSKMDYMTWFYDYAAYGIDSFATTNNGKLLASIVDADTTAANGNVLMARWAPGKETYTGGVTPMSYRTYLQMGSDDKSDPKNMHYAQYTPASFQLMVNEMDYLGSTYTPAGIVLGDDASLTSISVSVGTLSPDFSADVTMYSVILPDGTTDVPAVTPVATDANAVIDQTDAASVPGTTVIKVTSEDEQNELIYTVAFKFDVPAGDVVEPGMGTLDEAVLLAASGDTLVLKNGGQYDILSPLVIDKKLTIIAETIPELPALENMPIISNMFTSTQVFAFKTNCDLSLVGIDVDGLGGSYIFDPMADSNYVFNLHVNRCRLHNTIDDIMNDDASYTNNITAGNLHVRNTFMYDNGTGHGIYTKFYNTNGSPWVFENITMWNLGQQFTWIRVMADAAGSTQNIVFDHMTGYNLSTSADNKEIFGNDEKTTEDASPEADLVIKFKNNIMSTQQGTNEGSLIFKNTDGFHDITINNNVLFSCKPMANLGTVTETDNMDDVDPQFVDSDNGDFTVGNTDLHAAADDGKIVGAVYWHPDFVDDFSDVETGISERFTASNNSLNVNVFPNPVNNTLNLTIDLASSTNVALSIFNLNGQLVEQVSFGKLATGYSNMSFDASNLETGVYFYQVATEGGLSTGKLVKN